MQNTKDTMRDTFRIRAMKKEFHRKSRTGCRTCKTRRVKCDESRPVCSGCRRCRLSCAYDDMFRYDSTATPQNQQTLIKKTDQMELSDDLSSDGSLLSTTNCINSRPMPESGHRRLLELRLLHTWMTRVQNPLHLSGAAAESWWSNGVPILALQHDNLQYMMFATAASYIVRNMPRDQDAATAVRTYSCLALKAQQKGVSELSIKNIDAVCFVALLLQARTFDDLWMRPLQPYKPPMQWLYIGSGCGSVFGTSKDMLASQQGLTRSSLGEVICVPPIFNRNSLIAEEKVIPFSYLLQYCSAELKNPEILNAYESTLRILGSIHTSIAENEPVQAIARTIVSFPMIVPKIFIELVEKQRPRALAILAHYFALLLRAKLPLWWIGDIPRREIQGINEALPSEWQNLIRGPLAIAENVSA